jgi:D-glycero-D-manno-heptose 1,7-bisphosphate phosphatase
MRKVIFLDRDGIVNKELGDYILNFESFEIHPPLIPFLQKAKFLGYEFIIVTNQAGIAKGLYTNKLVEDCHNYLKNQLIGLGITFLEIYYCPHHPDFGNCLCRKPGGLFIEKALARFAINKEGSFMLGDKQRDVDAANSAGIKGYLLPPNPTLNQLLACLH